MYGREAYYHTRNYGCRLRRYRLDDVEMLSMENRSIKVVLALSKGADIVELVHKETDTDFMWHSFNQIKGPSYWPSAVLPGGNFMEQYAGGWQELFPTYGKGVKYHGGAVGVHGEACIYPWQCQVLRDEPECVQVKLSLRTVRSPFLLEKTLTLNGDAGSLLMHQKVTNLGSGRQEFMWGHHPAFGYPFLDETVQLHLKGRPGVTVPAGTITEDCPFDRETTGTWPVLAGRDGQLVDVSRACAPESRCKMEYRISDLEEGEYTLVNHGKGLGIRMKWDLSVFPYLWIWGLYRGVNRHPWYGRAYVMAVEPWSSPVGDFEHAKESGSLHWLDAGESKETELTVELIRWEDAK